jgi:hypothetical protein
MLTSLAACVAGIALIEAVKFAGFVIGKLGEAHGRRDD